jgi:hypothetical protein
MSGNQWVLNRMDTWDLKGEWNENLHPLSPGGVTSPHEPRESLGKLGFKSEPAGKVRVFAMVDPWTQWLMDPLHRGVFKLLESIPQDGTFDQLKPIERLMEWQERNRKNGRIPSLYSFDLSAATDRIPITLQKVLLSPFLTSWGAEIWGNLLVGRKYHCPTTIRFGKNQPKQLISNTGYVVYGTGQPMGALSSWAMLAFIHHSFVQWSALRAGVISTTKDWYEGYAILGDDVVIARSCVAKEYLALMKTMAVEIGAHKSLLSRNGLALEFAKRTFFKRTDVSMVPFAEFVVGRQSLAGLLELVRKYSLTLGQTLSVLGYGYRAKANASKRLFSMPKRLRNYILAFLGPGSPAYVGLPSWLPMKSVTSRYASAASRVPGLVTSFFEQEIRLCLEYLDSLAPLIQEAKKLGTVYRDREHYGTIPRGPDRKPIEGGTPMTTPFHVIDSLRETVYRQAFLESVIEVRDLRTKLEETTVPTLDWVGMEELRLAIRAIESSIAALPFPRNIYTRTTGATPMTEGRILKRWYRHSGIFRATVDPAGPTNAVREEEG